MLLGSELFEGSNGYGWTRTGNECCGVIAHPRLWVFTSQPGSNTLAQHFVLVQQSVQALKIALDSVDKGSSTRIVAIPQASRARDKPPPCLFRAYWRKSGLNHVSNRNKGDNER